MSYYRPSLFGGFSFFPPVIKTLLISNVVIWLLDAILSQFLLSGVPVFALFSQYLALWPLGPNFYPWQLLTYMFMHGGFWHLFFNMLALWMFGMELENTWGSKRFLAFYLTCGLGAGIANLFIAPLLGSAAGPTVGASGAVFGVLIAFGMLFPDRPIYIYFLLPIKAKYFVAIYIGLELFYGVTGTTDGIAHFAHLGGAAVGFIYLLADMNLIPVRRWWGMLHGGLRRATPTGRKWPFREEIRDAKFYDINTGKPLHDDRDVNQEVIDAILDKISKGGYQSLSEEEKRILNEASRKIQ